MSEKISKRLSDIEGELTAHLSGFKQVFLCNEDTDSKLTQFAYGVFKPGEFCPSHKHATMEECFFFLKGTGVYVVGAREILLEPNTFLRIPANEAHELKNTGSVNLEFVYFGIAID